MKKYLCKRIITVLTFNDGVLFRTKLFQPDYRYTLNFVDAWSVDEILVLDVTRPGKGERANFFRVVENFASRAFVPLTVGGGIRCLEDVRRFMDHGADKVAVNTGAVDRPELITEIAEAYGRQCVVLSIDAKKDGEAYKVYAEFGSRATRHDPTSWAREGVAAGAGEVLITAIDRDGWLRGYDIPLCKSVCDAVRAPVLILGGCGNWAHMLEGLENIGAAGVCTQNIYHFTEASIQSAKTYLSKRGVCVRI